MKTAGRCARGYTDVSSSIVVIHGQGLDMISVDRAGEQ